MKKADESWIIASRSIKKCLLAAASKSISVFWNQPSYVLLQKMLSAQQIFRRNVAKKLQDYSKTLATPPKTPHKEATPGQSKWSRWQKRKSLRSKNFLMRHKKVWKSLRMRSCKSCARINNNFFPFITSKNIGKKVSSTKQFTRHQFLLKWRCA